MLVYIKILFYSLKLRLATIRLSHLRTIQAILKSGPAKALALFSSRSLPEIVLDYSYALCIRRLDNRLESKLKIITRVTPGLSEL